MEFCLHYTGKLKSSDNAAGKHRIRIALHEQIERLCRETGFQAAFEDDWKETRREGESPQYVEYDAKRFWFLGSESLKTVVDLDITMLVPYEVGAIVKNGGDLDNRIKTLFDALRAPAVAAEIPTNDSFDYKNGMYCLLQDDKLINKVAIQAFRDFSPVDSDCVRCTIKVTTKITRLLWATYIFFSQS
jgi:hypothetical protein